MIGFPVENTIEMLTLCACVALLYSERLADCLAVTARRNNLNTGIESI